MCGVVELIVVRGSLGTRHQEDRVRIRHPDVAAKERVLMPCSYALNLSGHIGRSFSSTLRRNSHRDSATNSARPFRIRQVHLIDRARDRIAPVANYMEIDFGGANVAVTE